MKASLILAAAFWLMCSPLTVLSQEAQEETPPAAIADQPQADEPEAFDEAKFLQDFRALLAQGEFDEADAKLKEAIEQHPDLEGLRSLHYNAYIALRRVRQNDKAFEHLKAYTDYQLQVAGEGRGSAESFSQFLSMLTDLGAQIGGPERAFEILDDYAKQAQELDNAQEEIAAAIDTQRALQLAKAGRVDEAKALVDKQLESAKAALQQDADNAEAILRMAAALRNRVQLESNLEGGDPNAAWSELLEFLLASAKDHPDSAPIVQRFAMEHISRASYLARSQPDEADALLDRVENFGEEPTTEDGEADEANAADDGEKADDAQRPANMVRASFGSFIARLRQQIENTRKMLAIIGTPALYPENADGWVNGEPLTAEALKGKVVLLDFFAVWCGPCIATFPHLREWHDEYADQGLQIIGISSYYQYGWDEEASRSKREAELEPEAERAAMEHFIKHHELRHPIAFVNDKTLQEHYFVSGIPHVVVIDRQGKVRLFRIGSGEANAADLKKAIEESLAESPPAE